MDNEIQDKYVDAVIAMLMDEYADAEAEVILQQCKKAVPEEDVPEELDRKCQALIRKKFRQRKHQQNLRMMQSVSKKAAAFATVLFGILSFLFLTVDAVRTPIINFYLKSMGNHSVLVMGQPDEQPTLKPSTGEPADLLINGLTEVLPDGYTLTEGSIDEDGFGSICFINEDQSEICFNVIRGSSIFAVDTEDCDLCKGLSGAGIEGYYIEKGDRKTVVWMNNTQERLFTLVSRTLDEKSLLDIAYRLQEVLNQNLQ